MTQELTIYDTNSNYELMLKIRPDYEFGQVFFSIPTPNMPISKKHRIYVTARDIQEYPQYETFADCANKQVIEIGPGLAELVPYFAQQSSKKPIAIDPFDYTIAQRMLLASKEVVKNQRIEKRIDLLLSRIDCILNPSKVRLINTTCKKAIETNRDILHSADIVVDFCGALTYPETDCLDMIASSQSKLAGAKKASCELRTLEKQLLAPQGIHVSNSPFS